MPNCCHQSKWGILRFSNRKILTLEWSWTIVVKFDWNIFLLVSRCPAFEHHLVHWFRQESRLSWSSGKLDRLQKDTGVSVWTKIFFASSLAQTFIISPSNVVWGVMEQFFLVLSSPEIEYKAAIGILDAQLAILQGNFLHFFFQFISSVLFYFIFCTIASAVYSSEYSCIWSKEEN